jgi:hypothetical protein
VTYFPTISLKSPNAVRRIIGEIVRNTKVRRQVFEEIMQKPTLQCDILAVASRNSGLRERLIAELAKNPRLRRKLLKLAD